MISKAIILYSALVNAQETKPPTVPSKISAPPHTNWTHCYKESGQPAEYQLYDQIWVSNAIAGWVTVVWIHKRKYLTEDGSDHDPTRIELKLQEGQDKIWAEYPPSLIKNLKWE